MQESVIESSLTPESTLGCDCLIWVYQRLEAFNLNLPKAKSAWCKSTHGCKCLIQVYQRKWALDPSQPRSVSAQSESTQACKLQVWVRSESTDTELTLWLSGLFLSTKGLFTAGLQLSHQLSRFLDYQPSNFQFWFVLWLWDHGLPKTGAQTQLL